VEGLIPKHIGRIFIEKRAGKLGLGTAYIHGFLWALKRDYDLIFEMDADFSHSPNDLDRLAEACMNGADVAVGSRYVKGGSTENWPLDRQIYSIGGSAYTRLITGIPVKDPTAGFVCYKRKVLDAINLSTINFIGYAFQIEMKFAAWKLGFIIKEVPINFVDRKIGASKMTKGIIKEAILGVLNMQWQSSTGKFIKIIKRIRVNF
jgi:dolichol-phosphate mannosyltransferase